MKVYSLEHIMSMEQRYRATFINSIAGFKSLHLVGTINDKGNTNLAVFNSIFHVGANPPLLGMVFRPNEVERHTLENILAVEHYTLNQIHPGMVRAAHQCAARYPRETSEFNAVGLTPFFTNNLKAPYVKESRVKIGLELQEKINVKANQTIIVIGQIVEIEIAPEAIAADGFVNLSMLETCTVAGLDAYYSTSLIERLSYAKPDKTLKSIV